MWHSGLCDCFSSTSCCVATVCPCVLFGYITEKVGKSDSVLGATFWPGCCAYFWLCGSPVAVGSSVSGLMLVAPIPCAACVHLPVRQSIAASRKMQTNVWEDLFVVVFCPCCALVQEWEEVSKSAEAFNSMYGS